MRLSRLLGLRKIFVHLPRRFGATHIENSSISWKSSYNFLVLRKISVQTAAMSIENSVISGTNTTVIIKNRNHFLFGAFFIQIIIVDFVN